MKENALHRKVKIFCNENGLIMLKLATHLAGTFDVVVLYKDKPARLIEFKSPTGKGVVSEIQNYWCKIYTKLGIPNLTSSSFDEIKEFILK